MPNESQNTTPAADAVTICPDNMAAVWQQYCRLAYHVARPFMRLYPSQADDIRQECYIAMWDAVNAYNPDAGCFANYLPYHVRRVVGQYCRRNASAFSLPEHTNTGRQRLSRARDLLQAAGVDATEQNVLLLSGMNPIEYQNINAAGRALSAASLSDLIPGTDGLTVADAVPDLHNGIDDALENIAADDLHRNLDALLCGLPDADRDMVCRYYYNGQTLAEIGQVYGVAGFTVSRRIKAALRKLKRQAERSRAFDEYLDGRTYTESLRGGLQHFLHTWESSTETAAFHRMETRAARA